MKIFFDTEFLDDKDYLELLSIGLVREDGATYYAEVEGVDYTKCNDWVRMNVLPLFTGPKKSKDQIAFDVSQFAGEKPEFWAYFHAFDWVLLCKLFGGMLAVPKSWPHYCNEILHLCQNKKLPVQFTPQHHALNDALWNKEIYEYLNKGVINEKST